MRVLALLLAALAALLAPAAHADDLRPGYLEWRQTAPGTWAVTWKAPLLGGLATRARPLLPPAASPKAPSGASPALR
jgi:hypothetical protein